MSNCLFIDTSGPKSTIAVVTKFGVQAVRHNEQQQDHGKMINIHIQEVLDECGLTPSHIQEVWVQNGPGSYTGLRIGLATAKGLCYALQLPLYLIHRFDWLYASIPQSLLTNRNAILFNAREDEYYFCVYDSLSTPIQLPKALQLKEIHELSAKHDFTFFSDIELNPINNQQITIIDSSVDVLPSLIFGQNKEQFLSDLFLSEPFYLKNVHINKINNL